MMRQRAFTLIELLIVVAIIAILAAIAVPNFLEAQTRSRVSRVKADERSLATAIESYFVDHNNYPMSDTADMERQNFRRFIEWQTTRATVSLSTPIAYVTRARFPDPFKPQSAGAEEIVGDIVNYINYFAGNTAGGINNSGARECPFNILTGPNSGDYTRFWPTNVWGVASGGPNRVDEHGVSEFPFSRGLIYDPTNGTVSAGDICQFGPGGRVPKGYLADTGDFSDLPEWDNCEW